MATITDRIIKGRVFKAIFILISTVMILSFLIHFRQMYKEIIKVWWNTYYYSEFLINFQGGFVRRGLLGEMIFSLTKTFSIPLEYYVWWICTVSFCIVAGFLIWKFYYRRLNWWLILSPFLCGYVGNFIRKDFLCYCIFICIILSLRKIPQSSKNILLATLLAAFGLFIHEAFIFYGVPFLVFYISRFYSRKAGLAAGVFLVTIFGVLCCFKGNAVLAESIVNSWNAILPGNPIENIRDNSIGALNWSLGDTFLAHLKNNFYYPGIGWGLIPVRAAVFILSYYLIAKFFILFPVKGSEFDRMDARNISRLYLFSMIFMLPMFTVLSCDFARNYQAVFMVTMIIFLLIPKAQLSSLLGNGKTAVRIRVKESSPGRIIFKRVIVCVLLLFLSSTSSCFDISDAFYNSVVGGVVDEIVRVAPRFF